MNWIRKFFSRKPLYEYGTFYTSDRVERPARRNIKTGEVQFVLWGAGEQGYTEDYWHNANSYWWPSFVKKSAE